MIEEATMIRLDYLSAETVRTPDGETHRGNGALYVAARHLIATGTDPAAPMVVGWEGKAPSFTPASVGYWAAQGYGGEAMEPRPGKWQPHPKAEMPDALLRWRQKRLPRRSPLGW